MQIFLTGGTGYLGGAVLTALLAAGHRVTAHARSADSAATLTASGGRPVVGELTDTAWLTVQLADVDGMVHAASPNDATSAALDGAVLDAALPTFAGSDRPYVHTGGVWVHGSGSGITEQTPVEPPPMVGWRPETNDRVRRAAESGVRTCVIGPANLYGGGGGLMRMILGGPVSEDMLVVPGGDQHVGNVHTTDIAALYLLALEQAPAGSYYLGANDSSPTMGEIGSAAAGLRGLAGWRGETADAARKRLGPLADPLLLDQQIDCSAARSLGWAPCGPALLDELGPDGSYAGTAR